MKQLLYILLLPLTLFAQGQTVREITISADQPYTDNVSLARESGDMDVLIKFAFNEADNQITVSMTSYRGLFVFREDARYEQVVKNNKLNLKAMPYVVTGEEVPYKMKSRFRKQLGKTTKGFVFRRWINCTALQPVPAEYQMVNDVITQSFNVVGADRTSATITIGDVMIMEPKMDCCKKPYYEFLHFGRVATQYKITIKRNPCFGMEERITIAGQQADAAKQAFENLKKIYPGQTTSQKEAYDIFVSSRDVLQQQYPKQDSLYECPELQQVYDRYNVMVDSLFSLKCKYEVQKEQTEGMENIANPSYVLSRAYRLDVSTSRWQLTTDPLEKADIVSSGKAIIDEVNAYVRTAGLRTPQMREAADVFAKAVTYFKKTCHVR